MPKEMHLIYTRSKDVPQVYSLEYADGNMKITVHPKVYEWLCEHLKKHTNKLIGSHESHKLLGLREFIFPHQSEKWGFDGCVRHATEYATDWSVLICHIPSVLDSHGVFSYDAIHQLQASLNVFFDVITAFDAEISSQQTQLLHIPNVATGRGLHGGSVWAHLSPAFTKWVYALKTESKGRRISFPTVEQAMLHAHFHMYPNDEFVEPMCCSTLESSGLLLQVPGNACDLGPDDHNQKTGERGYILGPHNIDQPLQQFTFLAGLAKLYALAQKDIYGV